MIGYLIDNIENSNAALQAAIASVCQNNNDSRSDFEEAVAIILPIDSFTKNNATNKNISFEISSVIDNSGRGKSTGVDLR